MDRAVEDSMSDDTHTLLAVPNRRTFDAAMVEILDSMDWRQVSRHAKVELLRAEEIPGRTKMETADEASGECYLERPRRLRPIFVPCKGHEGYFLGCCCPHSVPGHRAFGVEIGDKGIQRRL